MNIKLRVLYMDRAWAEGIRATLEAGPAPSGDTPALVWVDGSSRPDVILLECVPGAHGTRARITRAVACAASGVLVACERCTRELLVDVLECGAHGCIAKASPPPLLRQALHAIERGDSWFSSAVLLQALRAESQTLPDPIATEQELTPREDQILHLIGLGMSNKEIGRQLAISDQTVKTHLHRVYVKLNRSGRYKAFLAQPGAPRSGAGTVSVAA